MSRKETREQIFKFLFAYYFNAEDSADMLINNYFDTEVTTFRDGKPLSCKEEAFFREVVTGIMEHIAEIDQMIGQFAVGWNQTRLPKVELSLLRLSVYEIQYREDVPIAVSVNEAIELAKKYGGDDSGRFVNGVLGKIVRDADKSE